MDICGLPRSWSLLVHTSWPLEYALRVFEQNPSTAYSPKPTLSPTRIQVKPSLTGFHVLAPPFGVVAIACGLAIVGGLISLAVFLLLWSSRPPPPKPQAAILSESTVLRIYDMASRQPYQMPPDGDGDPGTFPALPFARNPRKQSLFIFWLCFLAIAGAIAYVLSPFWQVAVTSYIAQKHATLSWTFTLILSVVLANIIGQFLQFAFFFVPIIRSAIQWAKWIVIITSVEPAATVYAAYLQVARTAQYLSHRYLGIPLNLPLPERIERSTTLVSTAVSAVGGYHLISSRVARNYTLLLKSIFQVPLSLCDTYVSLRHAPIFPTYHFQIWAWWTTKHILRFVLGELSWTTISWQKLSVRLFLISIPTSSLTGI